MSPSNAVRTASSIFLAEACGNHRTPLGDTGRSGVRGQGDGRGRRQPPGWEGRGNQQSTPSPSPPAAGAACPADGCDEPASPRAGFRRKGPTSTQVCLDAGNVAGTLGALRARQRYATPSWTRLTLCTGRYNEWPARWLPVLSHPAPRRTCPVWWAGCEPLWTGWSHCRAGGNPADVASNVLSRRRHSEQRRARLAVISPR